MMCKPCREGRCEDCAMLGLRCDCCKDKWEVDDE